MFACEETAEGRFLGRLMSISHQQWRDQQLGGSVRYTDIPVFCWLSTEASDVMQMLWILEILWNACKMLDIELILYIVQLYIPCSFVQAPVISVSNT